jgi:hypothetical protein
VTFRFAKQKTHTKQRLDMISVCSSNTDLHSVFLMEHYFIHVDFKEVRAVPVKSSVDR